MYSFGNGGGWGRSSGYGRGPSYGTYSTGTGQRQGYGGNGMYTTRPTPSSPMMPPSNYGYQPMGNMGAGTVPRGSGTGTMSSSGYGTVSTPNVTPPGYPPVNPNFPPVTPPGYPPVAPGGALPPGPGALGGYGYQPMGNMNAGMSQRPEMTMGAPTMVAGQAGGDDPYGGPANGLGAPAGYNPQVMPMGQMGGGNAPRDVGMGTASIGGGYQAAPNPYANGYTSGGRTDPYGGMNTTTSMRPVVSGGPVLYR